MNLQEKALKLHQELKGKLEIKSKILLDTPEVLSLVYTPGVAEPCREILAHPEKIFLYTVKQNLVGVITDGSAVLGLGNIGAEASLPVMEGKAILFKELAGVDAFPICIKTQKIEEFVRVVKLISPVFGGINLEDISSPRCFIIEENLKKELSIPVFHDDQHGTAVIVLAALFNALKLVGKDLRKVRIVINGAGAAGIAVGKFLLYAGAKDIILCDSAGTIYQGREERMNFAKEEIASLTNREKLKGTLKDALQGAEVFIGVSAPGVLTPEMVKTMEKDAIVFALANPVPEIYPEEAKRAGAKIVGTGRSDFPNQVNNALGFPGIFKGALRVGAREINEEMKLAASLALSQIVENELREDYILPSALDPRVPEEISKAVEEAAKRTGVARIQK